MLVDTHVLLWWQAGGGRLSRRVRSRLERADTVLVSPISIWETGMLVTKARVSLDRALHAWARDLFEDERVDAAPLSPPTAATAALLPEGFPGDSADRLLYATAREVAAPLATKDERLRRYAAEAGDVEAVW